MAFPRYRVLLSRMKPKKLFHHWRGISARQINGMVDGSLDGAGDTNLPARCAREAPMARGCPGQTACCARRA